MESSSDEGEGSSGESGSSTSESEGGSGTEDADDFNPFGGDMSGECEGGGGGGEHMDLLVRVMWSIRPHPLLKDCMITIIIVPLLLSAFGVSTVPLGTPYMYLTLNIGTVMSGPLSVSL